jgi:hypothetical protein
VVAAVPWARGDSSFTRSFEDQVACALSPAEWQFHVGMSR